MATTWSKTPVLSQIKLPSGAVYYVKDAEAREKIEALEGITGALIWKGVTETKITDGATTVPADIYTGTATPATGDVIAYKTKEFVWNGTAWQELGDFSDLKELLGKLAYADSASGSANLEGGSAAAQTFTGTKATISVSGTTSGVAVGDIDYTPAGSVSSTASDSTAVVTSVTKTDAKVKVLDEAGSATAGSAAKFTQGEDKFTATVADEVLTLGFTQGTDSFTANTPTAVTLPTFKDQDVVATMTVADGSVSVPKSFKFEGTEATLKHSVTQGSVTASADYTPEGTNAASAVTGSVNVTVTTPSA